jgi:sigma-B regulation protein RsbU (phosphoserine phosphatase)
VKPHRILSRVNNRLCENNDYGMFVTVFCGVLDLTKGKLSYCNGGHDAPLVGRAGKGFSFLESSGGPLLGVAPDANYESSRDVLRSGDTMLCYTDGVTEAMDPVQKLFGHEGLTHSVQGLIDVDAAHLVRVLHAQIRAFAQGAPQSDDIAVLALKYRGAPASA